VGKIALYNLDNLSDKYIMHTHNGTHKPKAAREIKTQMESVAEVEWRRLKARIIKRFGTVQAAAEKIGCHRNSPRLAAAGRCPDVLILLLKALRNGR
jgi:hypothetical protein